MMLPGRLRLKTYSHLAKDHAVPSEYNITSRDLFFVHDKGHSVSTPVTRWQKKEARISALQTKDVPFQDPQALTYAKYVNLQNRKEIYLEGIFSALEKSAYVTGLPEEWLSRTRKVLGAFAFVSHGLQMISAYLGQMAPGSELIIVLAMQTGDEIRCTENLAHHLIFQGNAPDTALDAGRDFWMNDAVCQPLRKMLEQLLVTWDWGEAWVTFQLLFKPAVDEIFLRQFAKAAVENKDPVLEKVLQSLYADAEWHQLCARTYCENLVSTFAGNSEIIQRWMEKWKPSVLDIIAYTDGMLLDNGGKSDDTKTRFEKWLSTLPPQIFRGREDSWSQNPQN